MDRGSQILSFIKKTFFISGVIWIAFTLLWGVMTTWGFESLLGNDAAYRFSSNLYCGGTAILVTQSPESLESRVVCKYNDSWQDDITNVKKKTDAAILLSLGFVGLMLVAVGWTHKRTPLHEKAKR